MARHWPPPKSIPGDPDGNFGRWKTWLEENYFGLELEALSSRPWNQEAALRMIIQMADVGDLSPEGALRFLRWCIKTSRYAIRILNERSILKLGLGDVLNVPADELQGASTADDAIRVYLRQVGGCFPISRLLEQGSVDTRSGAEL